MHLFGVPLNDDATIFNFRFATKAAEYHTIENFNPTTFSYSQTIQPPERIRFSIEVADGAEFQVSYKFAYVKREVKGKGTGQVNQIQKHEAVLYEPLIEEPSDNNEADATVGTAYTNLPFVDGKVVTQWIKMPTSVPTDSTIQLKVREISSLHFFSLNRTFSFFSPFFY
jgi:hypothetical protein